MRKKGFTLIELLAVIVILAIVLAIAIPAIGNLIESARGNTFTSHKKLVEKAASNYYNFYEANLVWEDNVSYVTIGELIDKDFLSQVSNPLNGETLSNDTKVLLLKDGNGKVTYSLQLYDDVVMDWYRDRMIDAFKKGNYDLPDSIGETTVITLEELMNNRKVDELRLPLDSSARCAGYVETSKVSDTEYEYNAYVDCLTNASTFASHYVSYGGKYIDSFSDVKITNDGGYIAVGSGNSDEITKYGNNGKGKYDAIIVKFSANGTVEWSHIFGGSNSDYYYSVVEATDGYVAVGSTGSSDGDLATLYKGDPSDALIVKYNKTGEVTYKRSYGTLGTTGGGTEQFTDVIKTSDGYVIVGSINGTTANGDLAGVSLVRSSEGIIIKFDNDFNRVWQKVFVGTYTEYFSSVIQTSDNGYLVTGSSNSRDGSMSGIGWETATYQTEAIIVKYDNVGEIQYKKSFNGSLTERFVDAIEVTNGYITIGNGSSNDYDMTGISKSSNGNSDAIIVKYDKTLSNILWKKSFGGTLADSFNDILKINDNEIIAVGSSSANDMDMNGMAISSNGYSDGIIVKYNSSNGSVVSKKVFGGTNSDSFSNIIIAGDNYVLAGGTYSSDFNLKNFNKGHSDAILVSYDNDFNLVKNFNENVILIDKLKVIVPNYGTDISSRYNNIYTTNNPSVELSNWCTNRVGLENSSNYLYGVCLIPFNSDDISRLTATEVSNGLKVLTGENEYVIANNATNNYNWHRMFWALGGSTGVVTISNLKLKFADGFIGSLAAAKESNYIEPLVTVSNNVSDDRPIGFFPTLMDFVNGGSAGEASYPYLIVNFKPKKSRLVSIIFTSSKNSIAGDGVRIEELRNFDMSTTITE